MVSPLRVIETIRRVALLGVRCLDGATGAPVTAGLSFRAVPTEGGPWTEARATASGLLAFHRLPGLHDAAFGDVPEASPPERRPFALILTDRLHRYQDVGLLLDLPRVRPLVLRLLPLPAAPPPPGLLTLYGALHDATRLDAAGRPMPAAFALVEAERTPDAPAAEIARGLADARGEFLVALPHPDPLSPPGGMVPSSPQLRSTLDEQRWPVRLRFRYQPTRQRWLRPLPRGVEILETPTSDSMPEIAALQAQSNASLAPPLPPGAGSPPTEMEVRVPFAGSALVRGLAADSAVLLLPTPLGSP
jgi:hypothetical protein